MVKTQTAERPTMMIGKRTGMAYAAIFAVSALALAAHGTAYATLLEKPTPGTQVAAEFTADTGVKMRYWIYLPKDYDAAKPTPLLLFLHGAGERGDNLELVKKHGPPKLISQGKDFPFIVISPQCPTGQRWDPKSLLALLDQVESKYNVDKKRVYVTGLSMGGFGTWALAAAAPNRFAAIAPICGGGEKSAMAKIASVPIWVFHGAKDRVVPARRSEELVEELKRLGADVKFTVYPEAGHDSWTETYDNPKLYEWFLSHHR